jgi:uncharacterized protein
MELQEMARFLTVVSSAAVVAFSSPAIAQIQPASQPAVPQIVTMGRGEIKSSPDRATIMFAVETRAATAAAAGSDNARRQRAVIDTLRKLGIPESRISTTGYQVSPEYSYQQGTSPRLIAYTARNAIRVEVEQLSLLGRYIDAALGAGANQISSLDFKSSREDELRREALAAAVTQARADAEAMARAAGGTLGGLLEVSSGYDFRPPMPMEMSAMRVKAADVETPIVPGEQSTVATVTASWAFLQR